MLRFILSILFLISFLAGAYIIAFPLFGFLLFKYAGFELVIIGLLIDGYFGVPDTLPLFMLGIFFLWTIAIMLRQLLIVYDNEYAPLP